MSFIDSKGRLFGKINIIDLCLVLVIVLAVCGLFMKKNTVNEVQMIDKDITYTVKITGIRQPTLDQFKDKTGAELHLPKTGNPIGTIVEMEYKDSEGLALDKNGNYAKSTIPGKYDITLTLKAEGTQSEKGIFLKGGKQLFIGDFIGIATEKAETSGEILSISVAEKE